MTSDDQVNAALEREAEFDRLELEVGASTAPYLRATTAERDRRVIAAEVRRYRKMRCDGCKHGSETLTQILEELRAINRNVDRIRLHMGVGL